MTILRLGLILALALAVAACGTPEQTRTAHDLTVRLALEPSPPQPGQPTTIQLVAERDGQPLEGAEFTVTPRMLDMDHPAAPLAAVPLGGGAGELRTSFAMAGRWELQVAVAVADRQPEMVTFELDVE